MSDLNLADASKRQNDLAKMTAGLKGEDAWYWRDKAMRRVRCLQEDSEMFGLVPHEQAELNSLKRLLLAHPNKEE